MNDVLLSYYQLQIIGEVCCNLHVLYVFHLQRGTEMSWFNKGVTLFLKFYFIFIYLLLFLKGLINLRNDVPSVLKNGIMLTFFCWLINFYSLVVSLFVDKLLSISLKDSSWSVFTLPLYHVQDAIQGKFFHPLVLGWIQTFALSRSVAILWLNSPLCPVIYAYLGWEDMDSWLSYGY